jgi:DNA-binding XRE family transcriptional regulator
VKVNCTFHVLGPCLDHDPSYDHGQNRAPSLAQIPKIIDFLGSDPFKKENANLGDRIREYRRVYGLSQKKLAEQIGIDPSTLAGWERGEHHPTGTHVEKMKSILVPRNP